MTSSGGTKESTSTPAERYCYSQQLEETPLPTARRYCINRK